MIHGRKESVEQVRQVLAQCQAGTLVEIIPVSIDTQGHVIEALRQKRLAGEHLAVVNLCDGTELDGYPGVSVVNSLQKCRIPYSGSDAEFYEGTTSKPVLKRKLIANNVATSPFVEIRPGAEIDDIQACEQIMSWPMIIKPSISYASMNISDKSVVHSREEALAQTKAMIAAAPDGVFVESFLGGREFTALCTGDARVGVKVYPIAERVFNAILKHEQRILAFDRYWDGYDLDGSKPPPDAPSLYWYDRAPADWQEELQDLARRAYIACGGNG
nr:hypothetical protein HK105_000083 [Polyrhizophydium stewartii]